MTTRVLVTGARGLIGRRVVQEFSGRPGLEVFLAARRPAPGFLAADLTQPAEVRELVAQVVPDVVVHLAGGPRSEAGPTYVDNVLPAVHLVEALSQHAPGARLVATGSAAEYGEGEGVPLNEVTRCRPTTDYGRAKAAQSALTAELADRLGLQTCVLRPFNLVAPDLPESTALGNFRRQLLAGTGSAARRIVCGHVDITRDFVSAELVARVAVDVCLRDSAPRVLNVCSGAAVALRDVFEAAAGLLGVSIVLDPDPRLVAIPAPDHVVGDPALLASLGRVLPMDATAVARVLLGDLLP